MGWFSRKVLVTLIDDRSGAPIATTKMPTAELPESFEIETTLHLGEVDWSVVHAEPRTREEYTKSGSLILRQGKVEKIAAEALTCSQVDITERFDDNRRLGKDEWISTTPLNLTITNPESAGLPSPDADSEEVYRIASKLSALRDRSLSLTMACIARYAISPM